MATDRVQTKTTPELSEEAVEHFEKGQAAFSTHDFETAIAEFTVAIELEPAYIKAYRYRMSTYYQLEMYDEVFLDLDTLVELDPNNPQIYLTRGQIKAFLEQYEAALPDYDKAIELQPDFIEAYYHRGLSYQSLEQVENAIEDYRRFLELSDDSYLKERFFVNEQIEQLTSAMTEEEILDFYEAGKSALEAEDYEQAISQLTYVVDYNPELTDAQYLRGIARLKLSQALNTLLEDTRLDFMKTIERDPDNAEAHYYLGLAYLLDESNSAKATENALAEFEQTLKLDPDFNRVYQPQGLAYLYTQQFEEAIESFYQALEVEPDNADLYLWRGWAYQELEEPAKAVADFEQYLETATDPFWRNQAEQQLMLLSHTTTPLSTEQADGYRQTKENFLTLLRYLDDEGLMSLDLTDLEDDFNTVIADIDALIQIAPTRPAFYVQRGLLYDTIGKHPQALQDFDTAIKLAPEYVLPYYYRGRVQAEMGQFELALEDYNQAITIDPTFAKPYYACGLIYRKLQDPDQAMTCFEQYLEQDTPETLAKQNSLFRLTAIPLGDFRETVQQQITTMNALAEMVITEEVAEQLQQGNIAFEAGDYETAITEMSAVIEQNPLIATAYLTRGLALFEDQGFAQGFDSYLDSKEITMIQADLQKSLELDPSLASAYYYLGIFEVEGFNIPQAISKFSEAIALNHEFALAYYQRARARDETDFSLWGKLQIIDDLSHTIALDPDFFPAYYWRGNAYAHHSVNLYENAVADYTTLFDWLADHDMAVLADNNSAITIEFLEELKVLVDGELNPADNLGELYYKRGLANHKLGEYEAAIADFTEYIAQYPAERTEVYENRGNAFFEIGEYEAALADFDTLIELKPDEFSYHKRAELNLMMKQYEAALTDLDTALEIDPENKYTYLEREQAYIEMGDYDNALADIDLLLNSSHAATAYHDRAQIQAELGNYDQALTDYQNSIDHSSEYIIAFNHIERAKLHLTLGNEAEALADFETAIAFDPTYDYPYRQRAEAYLDLQAYDKALTDLDYALRLDPNNAHHHLAQGRAFLTMARYTEAITSLNTTLQLKHNYAPTYNQFCRVGIFSGEVAQYLDMCEQAVALKPENGEYRDSRGIAYALSGDFERAIDDFSIYIDWSKEEGRYDPHGLQREEWLADLEAGLNPFDEDTLRKLRLE